MESLYESLRSREGIYTLKLESYLKGEESIDNLIQTFRSLQDTEEEYYEAGKRYFDSIRDSDYLCAIYFQKLDIEMR